jgi:hypothetical protein
MTMMISITSSQTNTMPITIEKRDPMCQATIPARLTSRKGELEF